MYFFYPYYWGNKDTWYESVLMDNDDPLFEEFLKAGSARVVVPVRESFQADLQYFLMTGQIWGGSEVPDVSDERYLSIVDEIKESTNAPNKNEVPDPNSTPWENRLPTSLIKLRNDGLLPYWEQKDPTRWEWTPQPKDS
jgi:hypothetical protein